MQWPGDNVASVISVVLSSILLLLARFQTKEEWGCQRPGGTLGGHSGNKAKEPEVRNALRLELEKYFGTF